MAIKMRNNSKPNARCCNCYNPQGKVLNMFDICIGDNIMTICDKCNEQLFRKTLSAECHKNNRLKSQKDLAIIRKRKEKELEQLDGD